MASTRFIRRLIKSSLLTRGSDIRLGVHPIELDHKIAVLLVDVGCFRRVNAREELWQRVFFNLSNWFNVEPVSCGFRDDRCGLLGLFVWFRVLLDCFRSQCLFLLRELHLEGDWVDFWTCRIGLKSILTLRTIWILAGLSGKYEFVLS